MDFGEKCFFFFYDGFLDWGGGISGENEIK